MFCPECGTENLDDSDFCKNCGKRLKKSKIPLTILVVSLITIASLGLIFAFNASTHEITPQNNTTTVNNSTVKNTTKNVTTTSTKELIDSGRISGYDGSIWQSEYTSSWKTYAIGDKKVITYIKWNFKDANVTFTQKATIKQVRSTPPEVEIFITPKVTGQDSYLSYSSTSANGCKDVVEYYWSFYRKELTSEPSYRH